MKTKQVMNIVNRLYEVGAISDFNWSTGEIEKEVAAILAAQAKAQKAAQPAGEAVCAECGRPATGHDKIGVRHAFTPSR